MIPALKGIDHVHVYVSDRAQAEAWYRDVLGLTRVEALMIWAKDGGPMTLEDPSGKVHVALFESDKPPTTSVAFGADGAAFLKWKTHLEASLPALRVTDHQLAWSMYFHDPFDNYHEITTYDHAYVRERLT